MSTRASWRWSKRFRCEGKFKVERLESSCGSSLADTDGHSPKSWCWAGEGGVPAQTEKGLRVGLNGSWMLE
jgi:hypothetical protein